MTFFNVGRLELWDLAKNNMLDPIASIKETKELSLPAKTMVRFGQNCPIIIAGDVAGDVYTYRLNGEQFNIKIGWSFFKSF